MALWLKQSLQETQAFQSFPILLWMGGWGKEFPNLQTGSLPEASGPGTFSNSKSDSPPTVQPTLGNDQEDGHAYDGNVR